MIVSPFDPANPSPRSQTTCLMVREDQGPTGPQSTTHTPLNITPFTTHYQPGIFILSLFLSLSLPFSELPYRFDYQCSQQQPDWGQLMRRAEWIICKYKHAHGSVQMDRLFRRDSHLTCLEKVDHTASLAHIAVSPIEMEDSSAQNTVLAWVVPLRTFTILEVVN